MQIKLTTSIQKNINRIFVFRKKQIRVNRWKERKKVHKTDSVSRMPNHTHIHTCTHSVHIREQARFVRLINRFKYLFLMSFNSFVMCSGYFSFGFVCVAVGVFLFQLFFDVKIFGVSGKHNSCFFRLNFVAFFLLHVRSTDFQMCWRRKLPAHHYRLKTVCFA